jgi:hypothetical protein
VNLGWVGQHVVTGQVQGCTWCRPSCAAELGATDRVFPQTMLLPKSLQLLRHKPGGGLLSPLITAGATQRAATATRNVDCVCSSCCTSGRHCCLKHRPSKLPSARAARHTTACSTPGLTHHQCHSP